MVTWSISSKILSGSSTSSCQLDYVDQRFRHVRAAGVTASQSGRCVAKLLHRDTPRHNGATKLTLSNLNETMMLSFRFSSSSCCLQVCKARDCYHQYPKVSSHDLTIVGFKLAIAGDRLWHGKLGKLICEQSEIELCTQSLRFSVAIENARAKDKDPQFPDCGIACL